MSKWNGSGAYKKTATTKVDSDIAAQKAENAKARKRAVDEYASVVSELVGQRDAGKQTLQKDADDARGRLGNIMASRGIGVGEGAAMNYGRLDSQHQGRLQSLLEQFQRQAGEAARTRSARTGAIDDQDRLLMNQRQARVQDLERTLEDRDFARWTQVEQLRRAEQAQAMQERQFAAAQANAAEEREWRKQQARDAFARQDWERERVWDYNMKQAQAEKDALFLKDLMTYAGSLKGNQSLAPLARYAKANGYDLNDYYAYLDPGQYPALADYYARSGGAGASTRQAGYLPYSGDGWSWQSEHGPGYNLGGFLGAAGSNLGALFNNLGYWWSR